VRRSRSQDPDGLTALATYRQLPFTPVDQQASGQIIGAPARAMRWHCTGSCRLVMEYRRTIKPESVMAAESSSALPIGLHECAGWHGYRDREIMSITEPGRKQRERNQQQNGGFRTAACGVIM